MIADTVAFFFIPVASTDFFITKLYNEEGIKMRYELYLDSYFLYNFIMDAVVCIIVKKIMQYETHIGRCLVAALLGAAYAVVCVLNILPYCAQVPITYIIIAFFMILIISKEKSPRLLIRGMFVLYIVTFFCSGVINWVYYFSQTNKLSEKIFDRVSLNSYQILTAIILVFVIAALWMYYLKIFKVSKNVYNTILYVAGKEFRLHGLLDTGNGLYDPISKKPVAIIEETKIAKIEQMTLNKLAIPYNSIGKKKGIIEGFVADWMIIYKGGEKAKGKLIAKPIIAIHKGKLCKSESYDMILHPNYFDSRGI